MYIIRCLSIIASWEEILQTIIVSRRSGLAKISADAGNANLFSSYTCSNCHRPKFLEQLERKNGRINMLKYLRLFKFKMVVIPTLHLTNTLHYNLFNVNDYSLCQHATKVWNLLYLFTTLLSWIIILWSLTWNILLLQTPLRYLNHLKQFINIPEYIVL